MKCAVKRSPLPKRKARIKTRGRRRFPGREDRNFLTLLRLLPCAVCESAQLVQTSKTEVEHWVTRARGGFDRGDTFPTCARHRQERHTLGDQTFQERYPARDWSMQGKEYARRMNGFWE